MVLKSVFDVFGAVSLFFMMLLQPSHLASVAFISDHSVSSDQISQWQTKVQGPVQVFIVDTLAQISQTLEDINANPVDYVIDDTTSSVSHKVIGLKCQELDIVHFVLENEYHCQTPTDHTLCTGIQSTNKTIAMTTLITSLGFAHFTIVSSTHSAFFSDLPTQIAKGAAEKNLGVSAVAVYDNSEAERERVDDYGEEFLKSLYAEVKLATSYVIVLCVDSETAEKILELLPEKMISGFVWIFCSETSSVSSRIPLETDSAPGIQLLYEGAIFLVGEYFQGYHQTTRYGHLSRSYLQEEAISLIEQTEAKLAEQNFSQNSINAALRLMLLQNDEFVEPSYGFYFVNRRRQQIWKVVNSRSEGFKLIGEIRSTSTNHLDSESMTWPGGHSEKPDGSVFNLKFTRGHWNFGDSVETGLDLAIKEVNAGQVDDLALPFLLLEDELDFSTSIVQEDIVDYLRENQQSLHTTIVALMNSGTAVQYSLALQQLEIDSLLLVTPATSAKLSDSRTYGNTFRTTQSDGIFAGVFAFVLTTFDWRNLCLLIEDGAFQRELREDLLPELNDENVHLLSDEMVPALFFLDLENKGPAVYESFALMRARKCRIFFTVAYSVSARFLMAVKYDLELYGENFMELASNFTIMADYDSDEQKNKVEKVREGAIGVEQPKVVGAKGISVKSGIQGKLEAGESINDFAYFAYDNMLLYAHAIQHCLNNRLDYESHSDMMTALQSVEFEGSTGLVRMQSGDTYDRSQTPYDIFNIQNSQRVTFGTFDPRADILFSMVGTPIWPGGENGGGGSQPKDVISEDGECPFYFHEAKKNFSDRQNLFLASVYVICSVGLVSRMLWEHVSRKTIEEVRIVMRMSMIEVLLAAGILLEHIQILSLGPRYDFYAEVIAKFSEATELNLEGFISLDHDAFWYMIITTFTLFVLFVVSVSFKTMNKKYRYAGKYSVLSSLVDNVNFLVARLCLVPILSATLDVYACDIEVSWNGVKDYYLSRDCYTKCDGEDYEKFLVLGTIMLSIFPPMAAYVRNIWQTRNSVIVKESPQFLNVKLMFIVIIITMDKIVGQSPLVHAYLFSISVSFYTIYCFSSRKIFNCDSFRRLQRFASVGVVWEGVVTSMSYSLLNRYHITWFIFLVVGWAAIAIFAYTAKDNSPSRMFLSFDREEATVQMYSYFFGSRLEELSPEKIEAIFKDTVEFREKALLESEKYFAMLSRSEQSESMSPVSKSAVLPEEFINEQGGDTVSDTPRRRMILAPIIPSLSRRSEEDDSFSQLNSTPKIGDPSLRSRPYQDQEESPSNGSSATDRQSLLQNSTTERSSPRQTNVAAVDDLTRLVEEFDDN